MRNFIAITLVMFFVAACDGPATAPVLDASGDAASSDTPDAAAQERADVSTTAPDSGTVEGTDAGTD